ncbi:hypothetical protein MKW94_016658 [Papaver nudicaule]|uniref:Uncharacterized protein n=1 Tax=Papaver nudicaule TaxID=74823 RepID=A0AA41VLJ8_PAPNU|nr:hypothetical protein [Papaver nudicaule]
MVSSRVRVSVRVFFILLLLAVIFYAGRPLYWKISATIHEIRENRQTVQQGISQIVYEAQKSVGWFHDESDSGFEDVNKSGLITTARRILRG